MDVRIVNANQVASRFIGGHFFDGESKQFSDKGVEQHFRIRLNGKLAGCPMDIDASDAEMQFDINKIGLWRRISVIRSDVANFYGEPDDLTATKAFLVTGDVIYVFDEKPGGVKWGEKETTGWIKKRTRYSLIAGGNDMTSPNGIRSNLLSSFIVVFLLGVAYGGWQWNEKQAINDLVSPGLHLINYTDDEVYTRVHYSKFPNPGEGASYDMGPNSGGAGLMCCVPIPTHWRPGIKMIVKYRFGRWPDGMEETKITELPEYPGGEAGDLYLVFHSTTEFELLSTNFAPGHPRWPGKHIETEINVVEK